LFEGSNIDWLDNYNKQTNKQTNKETNKRNTKHAGNIIQSSLIVAATKGLLGATGLLSRPILLILAPVEGIENVLGLLAALGPAIAGGLRR
jgi:hypothetical protein